MELFTSLAESVTADDLRSGDMILCGDKAVGIAAFIEVTQVQKYDVDNLVITTAGRTKFTVPSTQQVVRIV